MIINFNQIKISLLYITEPNKTGKVSSEEYRLIAQKVGNLLKISPKEITNIEILKKSIDARKKREICYTYQINAEVPDKLKVNISRLKGKASIVSDNKRKFSSILLNNIQNAGLVENNRPIICGAGPAGLFCAYILALNGLKPIIIEQGECMDDRINTVNDFWNNKKPLNPFSNVSFGEGGAGTFSDGKLNTSVKDTFGRIEFVKRTFVSFGAPEEIIYNAKPHIGTDRLRQVIINMRNEITALGGTVCFNTKLIDICESCGKIASIKTLYIPSNEERTIDCSCLILAIGHSARDTYYMLKDKLKMQGKDFAVGLRMQHSQAYIDNLQYAGYAGLMPPADYSVRYHTKDGRAVYSFCMCPGGYVVNASSEANRLVINGMSDYGRNSKNANSAIVVNVTPDDFGHDITAGIEFQRRLEEKAYSLCNGFIPCQRYEDYRDCTGIVSGSGSMTAEHKGKYKFANVREILPEYLNGAIIEAMEHFGSIMEGFNENVIMSGVETRTSAPLRIVRDELLQSSIKGIIPCGEGAGYAGGIMSAAVDGIKAAFAVMDLLLHK